MDHTRGGGVSRFAKGTGDGAASVGFGVQVLERDRLVGMGT